MGDFMRKLLKLVVGSVGLFLSACPPPKTEEPLIQASGDKIEIAATKESICSTHIIVFNQYAKACNKGSSLSSAENDACVSQIGAYCNAKDLPIIAEYLRCLQSKTPNCNDDSQTKSCYTTAKPELSTDCQTHSFIRG